MSETKIKKILSISEYTSLAKEIKKIKDSGERIKKWDELWNSFILIIPDRNVQVVWETPHFVQITYQIKRSCFPVLSYDRQEKRYIINHNMDNNEGIRDIPYILPRKDIFIKNGKVIGIRGYHVTFLSKRHLVCDNDFKIDLDEEVD